MRDIRSILVPTDFSECANLALEEAIGFARHFGARITLLHLFQLPVYPVSNDALAYSDEILRAVENNAEAELIKTAAHVRAYGVTVGTRLQMGAPAAEIVEEARRGNHDLIVMGTHGRTGLKHLLLGSVAERVVQLAPCRVLTVRESVAHEKASAPV
jgi:nucleotide-binding universal stress UspA family protein